MPGKWEMEMGKQQPDVMARTCKTNTKEKGRGFEVLLHPGPHNEILSHQKKTAGHCGTQLYSSIHYLRAGT